MVTIDTRAVDVNCDMGESFGNWTLGEDEAMMSRISSANVACGYHAGDPLTMAHTVALAREHGVAVGAHPGFPDLLGFGRRTMPLEPEEAAAYVRYQTGALRAFLDAADMELHHVKLHGALYALVRDDPKLAEPMAAVIAGFGESISMYWPGPEHGVEFCEASSALGIRVVHEFYPDLAYSPQGTVIIERKKLQTDEDLAASRMRRFMEDGTVEAVDGTILTINAESVCIHGDGPNAVAVADAVVAAIEDSGRKVATIRGVSA